LVICAVTENQGYRIVFHLIARTNAWNNFLLTHFEHVGAMMRPARAWSGKAGTGSLSRQTRNAFARRSCANNPAGMTMADRTGGLKLVGFIFATVTVAVMLTAAMVVKGAPRSAWSAAPMASKP
jgi:hypothetical protein